MSCNCNYNAAPRNINCRSCLNLNSSLNSNDVTQKIIQNQVRIPSSLYTMNLSFRTSASSRFQSDSNINWNQMSDRVLPANQINNNNPTRGNSLRSTLTSGKPGASTPGGTGVDVKHDSYARYLNRKKLKSFGCKNKC